MIRMSDPDIVGALSPPAGVIPDFEHPRDVRYTISLVTQILCLSIVSPVVLLKIYARAKVQKVMYREDWCCLVAWIPFLGYITTNLLFDRFGGGHHQWEVTEEAMSKFLLVSYAGLLVYGPTAFLIKCSLLLISTRLFAPFPRTVFAINLFMLLMLLFYLPMQFVKIMICAPISAFWSSSSSSSSSPSCFDQHNIYLADTIVSVLTDFAVLIIPMPLMWVLHLPLRRRLRVIGLLGAGGLAVAASVARLVMLLRTGDSPDRTITTVDISLLGVAETSIGLICATLPALNVLFSRYVVEGRSKGMDLELGKKRTGSGREGGRVDKDASLLRWTYAEVEVEGSGSDEGRGRESVV
ncbi:uncharacterized protein LY89DRAFT_776523 [Mollisia scopiformis]|uniref:Rhodopsin domain-containing protein n=1 Tax=Mollisia scopiformis TaxID=149040 RepID=A0A194XX77_MOLSC|nr:uncharacterized protein LY89DRAFT_776523 [Mollisia scopiformis]KUJ24397.1 hypothetical protein LY89DRAFT_776523 [Mollisia scopiformis]